MPILASPRFDDRDVLRELHDAVEWNIRDVAVGDEDVPVLGDGDIAWPAEDVVTGCARDACSSAVRTLHISVAPRLERDCIRSRFRFDRHYAGNSSFHPNRT